MTDNKNLILSSKAPVFRPALSSDKPQEMFVLYISLPNDCIKGSFFRPEFFFFLFCFVFVLFFTFFRVSFFLLLFYFSFVLFLYPAMTFYYRHSEPVHKSEPQNPSLAAKQALLESAGIRSTRLSIVLH